MRSPRMSRQAAFWTVAAVFFLLLFCSAAPTPLYGVYQANFHFSTATATAVFAVYALTLLVTLLVLGRLSDHVGRRPVIIAGLAINALACVVWLLAAGVGALYLARALQGVSVGLATGAIGAALLELQQPGTSRAGVLTSASPSLGLGLGAIAVSALAQYGPAPTHLVWWLLLAAFVVGMLALAVVPEPGVLRPGWLRSLRPAVRVPPDTRATFVTVLPSVVGGWALSALYLSLGPKLAANLVGSTNLLWGGLAAFLLAGLGSCGAVAAARITPRAGVVSGSGALVVGAALTFGAIAGSVSGLFLLGTAVAGVGFGGVWSGAYRMLTAVVAPDDRAGLVAAIFVVAYLSFSLPALIAGLADQHFGIRDTALVYDAVVAVLVAAAAVLTALRRPPRPEPVARTASDQAASAA
ncbi:MAG TPA: MFS transporter [Pseudonocardiaceae bacterium]